MEIALLVSLIANVFFALKYLIVKDRNENQRDIIKDLTAFINKKA